MVHVITGSETIEAVSMENTREAAGFLDANLFIQTQIKSTVID
jgi:hypothetical protein